MEKVRKVIELGKIDYLGIGKKENLATVELELRKEDDGKIEFSCCGNIWNRIKSDILCGGQCLDEIKEYIKTPLFDKIYRLWKLYHLNAMHAGTKKQEEFLIKNGYEDFGNRYKEACDFLKKNDLYYDNGVGFGCSWQYWEIPEDDLQEIKKINVEFDFDNKNNELHFNVFDNEEYVIGIFSDGFFINRVDHYTLYLSNMKSVLDFIKNNLK